MNTNFSSGDISLQDFLIIAITFQQNPSPGGVSLQDFLFIIAKKEASAAQRERLQQAFGIFDRSQNGFISADELKENMMTLGEVNLSDFARW
jgi:Ca2+-binding EF-hand superfamily protein